MTARLLITDASGATGAAVLASLAAGAAAVSDAGPAGEPAPPSHRIRALTTAPRAALPDGVERVLASLDDVEALRRALDGVHAVYLAAPPTERSAEQRIRFIELAAEAGVEHVVLLSQLDASDDSPARNRRAHAAVESALAASGLGATVLRANLLAQALLALAPVVRGQGLLAAPVAGARVSLLDVRDLAAVAATALLAARPLGAIDLTGPEALGFPVVAEQLGAALGRPIRFLDAPPQIFAAALRVALPAWQVEATLEDFAHDAGGAAERVSDAVPRILGHPALPFAAFARDYAPLFR
ncbi:NmrA family NAD(P)-binding protein [Schumannella soli]|uniref:SDR family NAD(P)-dependent oxidoreductase n=1 Tax=Schumannella soli TaxID=2590779 RepID=A0A506XNI1_9MICO|nr:NAD(P)H-binding protein [Schumannella soli]TPW74151.1 SDR family NAD(P)-dependent oxidoreductase [Schumannella soli]